MHYLIIDIDGTLFDNKHREHLIPEDKTDAKNWTLFNRACGGDTPIDENIKLVQNMIEEAGDQYNLVFLTARGMDSAGETHDQLQPYFGQYKVNLCMRAMGDQSHPVEFKRSTLNTFLLTNQWVRGESGSYKITLMDDHPEICDMVRNDFPFINVIQVEPNDPSN